MNCPKTGSAKGFVSTLETPDPHFIPGYLGYLPQEKYRPGHTYGITSHRILIDPCVHMSPRSILNNIHPENCTGDIRHGGLNVAYSADLALVSTRVNSIGRQLYTTDMTPGYTGYVPRHQSVLGHAYTPACNRALARFEIEQWRDRLFTRELEALDGWRHAFKNKPWEGPEVVRSQDKDLQEFARAPPSTSTVTFGTERGTRTSQASRLFSVSKDPEEYARRRIWGITNESFNGKPGGDVIPRLNGFRFSHPIAEQGSRVKIVYPTQHPMTSGYLGHIPNMKFKPGMTYGAASVDAKNTLKINRKVPICFEEHISSPLDQ